MLRSQRVSPYEDFILGPEIFVFGGWQRGGLNLLMVLALGGRRKGKGIEGEREKRD